MSLNAIMKAQEIQGTWNLVESSGIPVAKDYTQQKPITATHFIWVKADPKGNIISGASGTYTLKNGVYTETILYTLSGMVPFKGKKATYKVSFDNTRLKLDGVLELDSDNKIQNVEV